MDFSAAVTLVIGEETAAQADELLREFAEDAGIEMALVVDRSGALVAGISSEAEVTVEVISALVAGASGAMRALVSQLGETGSMESLHLGGSRLIYLKETVNRFVLVAVAEASRPAGLVREKAMAIEPALVALLSEVKPLVTQVAEMAALRPLRTMRGRTGEETSGGPAVPLVPVPPLPVFDEGLVDLADLPAEEEPLPEETFETLDLGEEEWGEDLSAALPEEESDAGGEPGATSEMPLPGTLPVAKEFLEPKEILEPIDFGEPEILIESSPPVIVPPLPVDSPFEQEEEEEEVDEGKGQNAEGEQEDAGEFEDEELELPVSLSPSLPEEPASRPTPPPLPVVAPEPEPVPPADPEPPVLFDREENDLPIPSEVVELSPIFEEDDAEEREIFEFDEGEDGEEDNFVAEDGEEFADGEGEDLVDREEEPQDEDERVPWDEEEPEGEEESLRGGEIDNEDEGDDEEDEGDFFGREDEGEGGLPSAEQKFTEQEEGEREPDDDSEAPSRGPLYF